MVVSGDTGGGGEGLKGLLTSIELERSKLSVHRFNLLPCLKWGNQKQLCCVKVSDSTGDNNPIINGASADCNFKKLKPTNDSRGVEEGIDADPCPTLAVKEKLTSDFKVAADKLKSTILRKGVEYELDEKPTQNHQKWEDEEYKAPPLSQSTAVTVETEVQAKMWNLRKRKPPVGGYSVNGKGLRIEERGVSNSSQLRSESGKSEEVRSKFALALSKKEIEDDLMMMLGHKAGRRVKKRPRNVQKQLDGVSVDRYKVSEEKKKGKK